MPRHPAQPTITPLPRKKKAWFPYLFFLFSLFLSISAISSIFTIYFQSVPLSVPFLHLSSKQDSFPGKNRIMGIALGVDSDQDPRRSDTLILFFIDRKEKSIAILSIPRDSRVPIPGRGLDKINHAFAFGGLELSKATVESIIERPLDYFIKINFEGFMKMVNLLGGVHINVEKRMVYTDRSQRLFINLHPGVQKLSGYQAMGYVRFRHDRNGDLGRIDRQQNFIRQVIKESLQLKKMWRWPALLKTAYQTVETDMPYGLILSLSNRFKDFDQSQLVTLTVPGYDTMISKISYFIPQLSYLRRVVNEFQEGIELSFLGIDIQVLNGTDEPHLAETTRDWLLRSGIPIGRIRDTRRKKDKTILRFPRSNPSALEKVKTFFPGANVEWLEKKGKAYIILGNDFKERTS